MSDDATATAPGGKRRNQSARRQELLQIAARIFAEKGIASATVRDIAEEAGILSGSLYHHFTSKEEMVREIITPGATGMAPTDTALDGGAPADVLRARILAAVRWTARKPDVARIFRNDAQYIKETAALADSEEKRQANRLAWIELVDAGIADGHFRDDVDADVVVRAMWDAILSSTRWFPPLGDRDPVEIGNELATFFLAGISRPRRPGKRAAASTRGATREDPPRRVGLPP